MSLVATRVCFDSYKDDELKLYGEDFLQLTGASREQYDQIDVYFKDLGYDPEKRSLIGVCEAARLPRPAVLVDPKFWKAAAPNARWSLMMHELNHCVCMNPVHDAEGPAPLLKDPTSFDDGCPRTLMHAVAAPGRCADAHRAEYVERLRYACAHPQGFGLTTLLRRAK